VQEPNVSDYSWFKLLVRAIGLLLLGLALPAILVNAGYIIWMKLDPTYSQVGGAQLLRYLPVILGYGAQCILGFYLMLGAEPIIARCLRGVRGRCATCGYDISSLAASPCPECGTPFTPLAPAGPNTPETPSP
jgi:hypothetical protein